MSLVIDLIDLMAKHKAGELRCPATALILHELFLLKKIHLFPMLFIQPTRLGTTSTERKSILDYKIQIPIWEHYRYWNDLWKVIARQVFLTYMYFIIPHINFPC